MFDTDINECASNPCQSGGTTLLMDTRAPV